MTVTVFCLACTLLVIGSTLAPPQRISGPIPAAVGEPTRIAWAGADAADLGGSCTAAARNWSCEVSDAAANGVVIVVGDAGVTAVIPRRPDIEIPITTRGRLVRVTGGPVDGQDPRVVTVTAVRPVRPAARPQTRRFAAVEDKEIQIVPISPSAFWVSVGEPDADAFLSVRGPAIGEARVPIASLTAGPPDEPLYVFAQPRRRLSGIVRGARGESVADAEVEAFALLQEPSSDRRVDTAAPLLLRRTTRTDADGTYQLDDLDERPLEVVVAHPTAGSGRTWLIDAASSGDVVVTPPAVAIGRVLKAHLPVPGARVRFVPTLDAFARSTDAFDYISAETSSSADGTFRLPLPARRDGVVHVIIEDGARVRVRLPGGVAQGDINLGDVHVAEPHRILVQLEDAADCRIAAIGPLASLGLSAIEAASDTSIFELSLPEIGAWALTAICAGRSRDLDPSVVNVADVAAPQTHVVRFR